MERATGSTCQYNESFLGSPKGILLAGGIIGILASLLQYFGNPGNMGICVACFERDIAGALGLHQIRTVQYLRPEILGLGLGAFISALAAREFSPRGGASSCIRLLLGMIAALGALVFLGCPWRAALRLAGGDFNALLGLAGLVAGIFIGTQFLRRGYSLGASKKQPFAAGLLFPAALVMLLALRLIFAPAEGEAQSGILWYSLEGPGSKHAVPLLSLAAGLAAGFLAQRSRFCTVGAFRDIFLHRDFRLFFGFVGLGLAAFAVNVIVGQFHPGFEGQPIAHTDGLWNFSGMLVAGLSFALGGGCPGRQLFASGEGSTDAACFALGMLFGAATAHRLGTASSASGIGSNGPLAVGVGLAVCLVIAVVYTRKKRD
ncbi:MAG: YedE family putative selenium transporter [Desulfovibrionaceae bacterium]|nr:YedE family putative selenium transporter [Desulfovibrionaceae bacterium]